LHDRSRLGKAFELDPQAFVNWWFEGEDGPVISIKSHGDGKHPQLLAAFERFSIACQLVM